MTARRRWRFGPEIFRHPVGYDPDDDQALTDELEAIADATDEDMDRASGLDRYPDVLDLDPLQDLEPTDGYWLSRSEEVWRGL